MIVNVGDLMVDVFEDRRHPGGKAALYAAGQALAGAFTAVVGAVGDDADGRLVVDTLSGLGVDTAGVIVVPGPTGWDEVDGESWFINRGANWAVDAEFIGGAELKGVFARMSMLVVNQGVPATGAEAALELARSRGVPVALALAPEAVEPERAIDPAWCRQADIVFVNKIEADHLLSTHGGQSFDEPGEVAVALFEQLAPRTALIFAQGVRGAVAVLGKDGAVLQSVAAAAAPDFRTDLEHYIGAGDALVGRLTGELAQPRLQGTVLLDRLQSSLGSMLANGVRTAAATTGWPGPLTCAITNPEAYSITEVGPNTRDEDASGQSV